jgi:hypothetical protein
MSIATLERGTSLFLLAGNISSSPESGKYLLLLLWHYGPLSLTLASLVILAQKIIPA